MQGVVKIQFQQIYYQFGHSFSTFFSMHCNNRVLGIVRPEFEKSGVLIVRLTSKFQTAREKTVFVSQNNDGVDVEKSENATDRS